MRRFSLLKIALLVMCCGLTMAGQKKPAQQPAQERAPKPANPERNKATARRVFEDLWSKGRADLVNTMFEPNATIHWGNRTLPLSEMVSEGQDWRSAFPDLLIQPHQVTENGDTVEVHWTAHGTNKGQGRGLPGKGKPAKTQGVTKFKFDSAGKITESWVDWDDNDVRRQVACK